MNKKYIILFLIFCLSFSLAGCVSKEAKTAVSDGNEALKTNNYEEAAEKFGYALKNGYEDDQELEDKYECLLDFLESKQYLEEDDIENANESLRDVDTSVIDGMEESVILLQAEINVRDEELASNGATILIIKNLIESANFDEAEKALDELEKKDLSEEQKKQLDLQRSNLIALSTVKDKATTDAELKSQQSNSFSSTDAFNNAENYIGKKAVEDTEYLQYAVMNTVEGPYTDEAGNKYFSVPVAENDNGSPEIEFYLKVFANGTIEEYDY